MALLQRLPVEEAQLDAFCRQWKIAKLELFGSMLVEPSLARDIDLLVTFSPDARWGLFEHERMQNELAGLLGRAGTILADVCQFMSPDEKSGSWPQMAFFEEALTTRRLPATCR